MCTVSWLRQDDGYQLFCNRDERRTRKAASEPTIHERAGVCFIAPVDGDHGGSWIGVNEYGLSLCLLNLYPQLPEANSCRRPAPQDRAAPQDFRSRGSLLIELLDCTSSAAVKDRLLAATLSRFQPFTLLLLTGTNEPAVLTRWDGRVLLFERAGDESLPLTSSSFRTIEVVAARRAQFRRLMADVTALSPDRLYDFHRSHEPSASASSVCLHRDDAETVSFSWINVAAGQIEFLYYPQALCRSESSTRVMLPLKDRSGI
ncbi:MAG TPA: NRDE family protein [Pyrinomonadaceae bacterium]|jgi:hypothetical protein